MGLTRQTEGKAVDMDRRSFLKSTAMIAALAGAGAADADNAASGTGVAKPPAKPRNRWPYAGLDWSKCVRVPTTSHGHCTCQAHLDAYLKHGYRFLTISNYYPSAPTVPGKTFRCGHYRAHHDFPVVVNGVRTEGPFDWNEIIRPWAKDIDRQHAGQYPLKEEGLMFPKWPDGLLEAPNAEHHSFLNDEGKHAGALHLCAPGSAFASGTFDARDRFKTSSHGYCYGSGENWRVAVDRMIAGLVHADGGGVTVNHPTWTMLGREFLLKLLDHDPRVLGCEVLEAGVLSENYWDWALATGRQCFGFFVPDHSAGSKTPVRDFGANVLIVPELTVHECLKAYRLGNFYGSLHSLGELAFTKIAFDGKTLVASTDKPARFQVVTARGVVQETEGAAMTWEAPRSAGMGTGPRVHVFARVKAFATDGSGEILFSQPFMLDFSGLMR